jgi:hypothetical protein
MSAEPLSPAPSFSGIGLAVDAVARPAGTLAHEACELSRLAGGDAEAAALIHLFGRLLACSVPVFELMDLFARWAARLEALVKAESGAVIRIRQRVARGQGLELKFSPGEDTCGRPRRR